MRVAPTEAAHQARVGVTTLPESARSGFTQMVYRGCYAMDHSLSPNGEIAVAATVALDAAPPESYDPMSKAGLHRRFAGVDQTDSTEVLDFIGTYGFLLNSSFANAVTRSESLAGDGDFLIDIHEFTACNLLVDIERVSGYELLVDIQRAIIGVREAVMLLDAIAGRTTSGHALPEHDLYELLYLLGETSLGQELLPRVQELSMAFFDPERQVPDPSIAAKMLRTEWGSAKRLPPKAELLESARSYLAGLVSAHLMGAVETYLDAPVRKPPRFRQRPTSLLGAIWLHISNEFVGKRIPRQCETCGQWFVIGPKGRATKRYCAENGCRQKAYRDRKKRDHAADLGSSSGCDRQQSGAMSRETRGSDYGGKLSTERVETLKRDTNIGLEGLSPEHQQMIKDGEHPSGMSDTDWTDRRRIWMRAVVEANSR